MGVEYDLESVDSRRICVDLHAYVWRGLDRTNVQQNKHEHI
jgi:hypothetical protein